jgi:hypothetical protein
MFVIELQYIFCEVQIIYFEDSKCTSGFRTLPFNWSEGQEIKT